VQLHGIDAAVEPGVPLLPVVFDLGKLWHAANLSRRTSGGNALIPVLVR
jgi:hypothetical protein